MAIKNIEALKLNVEKAPIVDFVHIINSKSEPYFSLDSTIPVYLEGVTTVKFKYPDLKEFDSIGQLTVIGKHTYGIHKNCTRIDTEGTFKVDTYRDHLPSDIADLETYIAEAHLAA